MTAEPRGTMFVSRSRVARNTPQGRLEATP